MTVQSYHIVIYDYSTGEIYLDAKTKEIDLHSSAPFVALTESYINILRNHPFARFNISPIRSEYKEGNLFV